MSNAMADTVLVSAPARSRWTLDVETIRQRSLWLMVFAGSFVMFEPSPYELFAILAIVIWMFGGMKLSRELMPVTILIIVYMIGSLITLIPVMTLKGTAIWTAIGWFLAFTGLFYAMVLTERTVERLDAIIRAYIATSVLCAALGIAGYFHAFPGAFDALTLYERAKSTFNDPNVYGPFLVLPVVILIQRIYMDGMKGLGPNIAMILVLLFGLFLSMSRAAWGHVIASILMMTVMTFFAARSSVLRTRILGLCLMGVIGAALALVILLQIPAIQDIFVQRASLDQSYDGGRFGRFGRHWLGFDLALDKPIGIGMLQFGPMFGEDTHNTFLNAFMSYGWMGGIAWPVIVAITLFAGYRNVMRPAPWRHIFICVMATYQIVIFEAWIIDVDHWRHVWLLFGLVWGLAIATERLHRRDPKAVAEYVNGPLYTGRARL